MLKFEKKIIEFINKNYFALGIIIITILALNTRLYMLDFKSRDYNIFLLPWLDYFRNNGGVLALANYPGDYNAPYMTIMALLSYIKLDGVYLIKGVSIIFDFGLAISSAYLVKYLVHKNKELYFLLTYSVVLFMPEVVMNSSLWSQCDSGYTLFIVLALLFLFKEKYINAFICLGVSFALKLQFIFVLPVFIIVYIVKKRFSILYFLIIPVVNFVLSLPAIIAGKPIIDLINVYIKQTQSYKYAISLNVLNIYELIDSGGEVLAPYGICIVMAICLLMLIYIISKKVVLNNQKILNLSLWFTVIVTFLLPYMHDRYLYVCGILALIYYIVYKKNLLVLISVTLVSLVAYFGYLFGSTVDIRDLLTVMYAVVIVYYTKDLLYMLCEDNNQTN